MIKQIETLSTTEPPNKSDSFKDLAIEFVSEALLVTGVAAFAAIKTWIEKAKKNKPRYYLDPSTKFKADIDYHLSSLQHNADCDWVTLAILSNGEVTDTGYHFTKLNFEFTKVKPEQTIPNLSHLSAVDISVSLLEANNVTMNFAGYHVTAYPIRVNNLLVAIVFIGNDRNTMLTEPFELQDIAEVFRFNIGHTLG